MSLIITMGYGRREAIMTPLNIEADSMGLIAVAVTVVDPIEVAVSIAPVVEVTVAVM